MKNRADAVGETASGERNLSSPKGGQEGGYSSLFTLHFSLFTFHFSLFTLESRDSQSSSDSSKHRDHHLYHNLPSILLHNNYKVLVRLIIIFSRRKKKENEGRKPFFILHSSFNNRVSAIFHFSLFTFHFSLSSLKPAPRPLPPFQKE